MDKETKTIEQTENQDQKQNDMNTYCMFCKQPHTENIDMYEVQTKDIDTDEIHTYHICGSCIEHLQTFLSQITHTPLKYPETNDPRPEDAFIGMLLKDFLCTQAYITTTYDVIFYDYTGLEITEFTEYIQHPIHNIRTESKTEKMHVMLGKK